MTDNYDLDAHEHEHEHEHGPADEHESKAEAWQDEQAPVDDLMEDGTAVTEEAGVPAQEEVAEVKKGKSSLPVILGVIVLAGVCGAGYWQFHKHATSSVSHAQMAQNTPSMAVPHMEASPANDTDVAPKTSLAGTSETTPSGSASSAQAGTALPASSGPGAPGQPSSGLITPQVNASAPVITESVAPTMPLSTATTTSSASNGAPPVTTSNVPTASPIPAASSSAPLSPGLATVTIPSNPAAPNPETEARIENLSSRIDDLKKALDQTTQQLTQAQASMAVAASSGSESRNRALEERLDKIEQQMSQLEHTAVTTPAAGEPKMNVAQGAENTVSAPTPVHKTVPTHKAAIVRHKSVKTRKTVKKTAPKEESHMAKLAKKNSSDWVLRAATPDEAWVAKDETSPELRHVQVGDELPGIGRVKAIQQAGDSWTIQGSTGTIR